MAREDGFQNDTQVADLRGWADGAAVNEEEEISHLPKQCCGDHNQELCLVTVKFEEGRCHPGFYVVKAIDYLARL